MLFQIEAVSESAEPDIVYILKSVSNNGGNLFTIGRVSGDITLVSGDTNYEDLTQYTLVVEAQDRGVEPFRYVLSICLPVCVFVCLLSLFLFVCLSDSRHLR